MAVMPIGKNHFDKVFPKEEKEGSLRSLGNPKCSVVVHFQREPNTSLFASWMISCNQ